MPWCISILYYFVKLYFIGFLSDIFSGSSESRRSLSFALPPKDDMKKDTGNSPKKDKDPVNESGGEATKKWSTGKVGDKLNHLVLFENATHDKLCKELPVQGYNPSCCLWATEDRASLARAALQELLSEDLGSWLQSTELK